MWPGRKNVTQADFIYLEFNWHLSIWVSYLYHNEDIRFVLLIWFRNFSFCCHRCWHHHLQLRAPAPSLPYHDDHFLIVITTIVISITIFISVMRTAVWTDVYCHCHHCHLYVIEFRMTFSNISLPSLRQLLKFPARGKYEMLPASRLTSSSSSVCYQHLVSILIFLSSLSTSASVLSPVTCVAFWCQIFLVFIISTVWKMTTNCNARQCVEWEYAQVFDCDDFPVLPCNASEDNAMHCKTMWCNARQCNAMQDNAVQCNALKRFSCLAVHRNIRQCYAMQDNVMQCKTM